jgi:hypothetical protein
MNAADGVAVGWNVTGRSADGRMTPERETHTFRIQPRGHLFGGILMVVTAVVLAAAIGVQTSQSILFRTLFGLGCLLYAWLGERLARVRVQVHGGQLIVHNELRTRTVNASDVREITWDRWRNRGTRRVVPRVHLAGGDSFRLTALWSHGSRQAELVTTVEEILSLLGVHVPVQGQPPDQASDQDRDSSLLGAHLPVQEQFPGQLPDQAAAPDSSSGLPDQSPVGLPNESVGVPRPPRQFRKGLRHWLPIVLGLALGVLYIVSATVRVLVILLYAALALLNLIRFIVRPRRNSRARPQPPSRWD